MVFRYAIAFNIAILDYKIIRKIKKNKLTSLSLEIYTIRTRKYNFLVMILSFKVLVFLLKFING